MSLIRATLLTVSCFGFDDFSQTRQKLLSAAQQEIISSRKKLFFFFFPFTPPATTPSQHPPPHHNHKTQNPMNLQTLTLRSNICHFSCQKKKKKKKRELSRRIQKLRREKKKAAGLPVAEARAAITGSFTIASHIQTPSKTGERYIFHRGPALHTCHSSAINSIHNKVNPQRENLQHAEEPRARAHAAGKQICFSRRRGKQKKIKKEI